MIAKISASVRKDVGMVSTTIFNDVPVIQISVEGKVQAMMKYNPAASSEVINQQALSLAQATGLFGGDIAIIIQE